MISLDKILFIEFWDTDLEVSHSVPTSGRRALALRLQTTPFPRRGIKMPEVVVMIERALLGRRELSYPGDQTIEDRQIPENLLTTEQIHTTGVPTAAPSMSTPRKGTIRTGNLSPLPAIDIVNEKIVEERGKISIKVLSTIDQQLVSIRRRSQNRCRRAGSRWSADNLSDLEEFRLFLSILR